jgi:hypothetical protein
MMHKAMDAISYPKKTPSNDLTDGLFNKTIILVTTYIIVMRPIIIILIACIFMEAE